MLYESTKQGAKAAKPSANCLLGKLESNMRGIEFILLFCSVVCALRKEIFNSQSKQLFYASECKCNYVIVYFALKKMCFLQIFFNHAYNKN